MLPHHHVTDAGLSGTFAVNTFARALRGVAKPLPNLPHVIHVRRGRPAVGVAVGRDVDLVGRARFRVIAPAQGPRGPYVETIAVLAAETYANPDPLPEGVTFLVALEAYRTDPTDSNWEAANRALDAWSRAAQQRPPARQDAVASSRPR